jgi:3'(2'), 5'-bisphosphate nucleotidase
MDHNAKTDRSEMLESVMKIVRVAGDVVLEVYGSDFSVLEKGDASPVTEADLRAESVLLEQLAALTPEVPIVSEEAAARGCVPSVEERFWLVDPLDGTKDFISRTGEFTVNVAMVESGQPTLGVVLAPALGRMYGGIRSVGALVEERGIRSAIACRRPPAEGLTVVSSRFHGDPEALKKLLANRRVARMADAGSSLKFCMVAAGQADFYPRLGRTMEWDTAAGHAVLAAAGGRVSNLDGTPLRYGKPQFENPHFIAEGLPA